MTEQVQDHTWPQGTDFSDLPVTLLDVGNRPLNVFRRQGIRTYQHLLACEEKDLTDMRGFGPECLIQVVNALAKEGLRLKSPDYAARR